MLSNLEDSYTRFLEPKEFNQMRIDTSGELTGVGIQIVKDKESDDLIIVSPIEDTPAYDAGLKANDKIISIDDISTEGMNIEDAVRLIRGQSGTKVKLEILRGSESFFKVLSREKIEIKSVLSKVNQTKNDLLIGYIRIKQFFYLQRFNFSYYKKNLFIISKFDKSLRINPLPIILNKLD